MINLDALTNRATFPTVILFGREVVVQPLTTAAAHRIAVAQEVGGNGSAMLAALLGVVASSCPDLSSEEIDRLSVEQVSAIVQLSRGMVEAVEKMLVEREQGN